MLEEMLVCERRGLGGGGISTSSLNTGCVAGFLPVCAVSASVAVGVGCFVVGAEMKTLIGCHCVKEMGVDRSVGRMLYVVGVCISKN